MVQDKETKFNIGNIPIKNPIFFAPMDGFSDKPFRKIIKSMGAGVVFSEFINGHDVMNTHPDLQFQVDFDESERIFAYQIFDDVPERLLETAIILEKHKPDFIDVNMGCSSRNVTSRGAGAGLLRHPKKIEKIFHLLTKNIQLPITGKIRLGWDEDSLNYIEVAKILEDNGAAMLTVHGRTKKQGFTGKADWEKIAEVKQTLSIPVIANGDVKNVADIDRIQTITKCDGVMIGRAALSNPWIFSLKDKHEIPNEEIWRVFNLHMDSMIAFYGLEIGFLRFRKHLRNYIDISHLSKDERTKLFNHLTPQAMKDQVQEILKV